MQQELFVSNQEKWIDIAYEIENVSYLDRFYDAVEKIKRTNDILNSAPQNIGGGIAFPHNTRYVEELYGQWQNLCKFANGIHYEVADLIDVPFTKKMGEILENLYSLQPKDYRVDESFLGIPVGSTLENLLIDMTDNEALKESYESMVDTLNDDNIEVSLEECIIIANYWEDQFVKATKIKSIAEDYMKLHNEGWKEYTEDERLSIINAYANEIGTVFNEKEGEKTKEAEITIDWDINDPNYDIDPNQELENGSTVGFYTSGIVNGDIYISYDKVNKSCYSFEATLETVTHEVRHLYQGQAYHEGDELNVPESVGSKWHFDKTKEPNYWDRPWEIDARAFAGISQSY